MSETGQVEHLLGPERGHDPAVAPPDTAIPAAPSQEARNLGITASPGFVQTDTEVLS